MNTTSSGASGMLCCCETLDRLPVAGCLLSNDWDRVLLHANDVFYRLIGCSKEEFQYRFGGRLSAVMVGEWPSFSPGLDGETSEQEYRLRAEGLAPLWIRMTIRYCLVEGEALLFCVLGDITAQKEAECRLRDYQDGFEWASLLAGSETFEYDIETQRATVFHQGAILEQVTPQDQEEYGSFQQVLIQKNLVVEADTSGIASTFASILHGEAAVCEARMRTALGDQPWMRLSMKRKQQDPECKKVVGTFQNISEFKTASLHYLGETQLLQLLLSGKESYALVDASADRVLRVGGGWFAYQELIGDTSYSQLLEVHLSKTVHPDDIQYYLELLQPQNLNRSLQDGVDRLCCRIRVLVAHNHMAWTELGVHLFHNLQTKNVDALIYTVRQDSTRPWTSIPEEATAGGEITPAPQMWEPEFERFLSENGDIAYLVDMSNFQLLVGNEALYRRVGLTRSECVGKTCYWVMHRRQSPCPFCGRANWSRDQFYVWKNWNEQLQQDFIIKNKIVHWQGRDVLLALAVDVSKKTSILNTLEDGGSESHAILCGIQRMSEAPDLSACVYSALETIGTFFGARAVQYWEYQQEDETFFCHQEWKRDIRFLEDPQDQRISLAVNKWLHDHRWTYPVDIESQESMLCYSFEMYELLKQADIENQRWVPIREGDNLWGVLVVMNLSTNFQNSSFLPTFETFLLEEWRRRTVVASMMFASAHDELTGFFNRSSFERYLQEFTSDGLGSLGVVSASLNDLQGINNRDGFQAGDDCIRHFASKLQSAFHEGTIYRVSSDEFIVVLPDFSLEKLAARTEELEDEIVSCRRYSVYIGYAWDNIENELGTLAQQATQSMRLNKKQQFDSVKRSSDRERQTMVQELLATLERREFEVFLQPKVNLYTGNLMGAEALVRYRDKDSGVVPPSHFIDILEKQNLIRFIDFFVFEECCRLLEKWKKENRVLPLISFNFSRLTLLERGVASSVEAIFSKYHIPKEKVEIEITESVADMGKGVLYQAAHELYNAGFTISLDDFGTKYTNLDILSELDFDMLKVDKSLVSLLTKRRNNQIILQNILKMCKHLNIAVVAEGVETKAQEEVLRNLGCRYGQGYLYGRPMPVAEFEKRFLYSTGCSLPVTESIT